jgi:DNA polymerase-3 subunit epsilon
MRVLCIDFETANYNPESACAIGYALIENGILVEKGSSLIKPHENYSEFIPDFIRIHGIKPAHVRNKPEFPEIYEKIRPLFIGSTLAAHFAVFDSKVLHALIKLYSIDFPQTEFICTCKLTQSLWKQLENHKLPTVCKHIKYKLNHHDAGSDAEGCSAVLRKVLRETGATTVEELAYISGVKIGVLNKDEISYRKGKKSKQTKSGKANNEKKR